MCAASAKTDTADSAPDPGRHHASGRRRAAPARRHERQIHPAGQTENERGRRFEVAEGLKPGDRVAAAVSGTLRDGDIVQEQGDDSAPVVVK